LTEQEKTLVQNLTGADLQERVLRIWCAKEAAAKYLGLGLQGDPTLFEVSFLDDALNWAEVTYQMQSVAVSVALSNNYVLALAGQKRLVN